MRKFFSWLLLLCLVLPVGVFGQEVYNTLYDDFSRCIDEMKPDSALLKAREMNAWVLRNESDTGMRYAMSLHSIAMSFAELQKMDSAVYYYNAGLASLKRQGHAEHPYAAKLLNNVGNIYSKGGEYKLAEQCHQQAMAIRKKFLGVDHPDYGLSMNNMGNIYVAIGDYKSAEPLYLGALAVWKKNPGAKHPWYVGCLNNLGNLYKAIKYYDTALRYYNEGLTIARDVLGPEHPFYAGSLQNIGVLFYAKGEYSKAEPFYLQAAAIYKKVLGETNSEYIATLANLPLMYTDMGSYDQADSLYKEVIRLKSPLGEYHPLYIGIDYDYSDLLLKTNRSAQAYVLLQNIFNKKSRQLVDNFEWLDDNQKEAFWKKESAFYEQLSWFAHLSYKQVPASVGLNYNATLVAKSKLLEAKISSENYYRDVDELRDALAYRRRLLAKMESEGSGEKDEVDKLRLEADSLDKRLTLSWPEYAQQKKNLSVDWEQVQQNLEPGEAALEFVRFKNEEDSLYYYNALLLRRGDSMPRLIPLCREADLKNIKPRFGYSRYYAKLWQPLEEHLGGIRTIYYSPVGLLNNVPFGALYASTGKEVSAKTPAGAKRGGDVEEAQPGTGAGVVYLMDRYKLHQLTSTRYLALGLKKQASNPVSKSMLLAGGINYDYLPGNPAKPDLTKAQALKTNASRSSASASGKLAFLPGTRQEIEQIGVSLSASTWNSVKLENNDATEENIIKNEGKEAKGVMHLATHGYAFEEYDFNDSSISKHSLRYSYRYSKNPMVRSGLILSGGNWAWTGSDTLSKLGATQNGILTALEVSQLNLRKTKLVVLSACETGLGKIEGSEGTFGLKRAFKLAGVEQLIVSLWSVPDKETKELMGAFYADLASSLNPVASFEKAQQSMRIRYPQQPEKWAGFVLVR